MLEDPCPKCGHKRKPSLMATHPDAPGLFGLLRGEGDPFMQVIAKAIVLVFIFFVCIGIFALVVA